tara:strand:+ start:1909 stop:2106 length:198 start_codon:yes stop_codon:yes gene_type:complete
MPKFQNQTGIDVYIDMGKLRQVKAGEILDLKGTHACPPLTILRPTPSKKKKPEKKTPPASVSGTI